MKKYIENLLTRGKVACGVGFRNALLLLVAAGVLGAPRAAWAYKNLETDRVLLMNNDSRPPNKKGVPQGGVTYQGYYDTNATAGVTFWTHDPPNDNSADPSTELLLHGKEHIFHAADGTPLWRLVDCRAGYIPIGPDTADTCNFIPVSQYAEKSNPPQYKIPTGVTTNKKGQVIIKYSYAYTNENSTAVFMRNGSSAAIYSPYYKDGIGTLYFDTVNTYIAVTNAGIQVQIATNLTEEAMTLGECAFEDVDRQVAFERWDDYYNWQTIPLTALHITGSAYEQLEEGITNLVLNIASASTHEYYRIRTKLNYYGPIRFRIKRTAGDGAQGDTTGLIAVDNIIASFPPMTVRIHRNGTDYDEKLTGTSALGCTGDFDSPFLTYHQTTAKGMATFSWVTNYMGTTHSLQITEPRLHYRWRYLGQKVNPWRSVPLVGRSESGEELTTVEYRFEPNVTNLLTQSDLVLGDGVGDLEYFYTADVLAPYYTPCDYANDGVPIFGLIPGTNKAWSEEISAVTNRLSQSEDVRTPALGHDYFTRVREGESDYKWIKLCTTMTTNGVADAVKQDYRMELVGDHTWRYHYYVPTNHVGETFSFHFQGEQIFTNQWVQGYQSRTNTWYCDLREVPYIPYTSAAGLGYFNDISCTLDEAATHLLIEFNDELLSFSISHAAYQDFNAWTDATVGYVGHTNWNGEGAIGVADTKEKFTLEMSAENGWKTSVFTKDFWREEFLTQDWVTYPYHKVFDSHRTPNGWTAGHGQFIHGMRGQDDMALQIEGRGQGYLGMDGFSTDMMPKGIDKVEFHARIAQEPRFEDFAWYMDGITMTNYAVSARLSMSHKAGGTLYNPEDVSPGQPSISLVGYYRPSKGCYEFRISRLGQEQLCASLYKWSPGANGMTSQCLVSNVCSIADNDALAHKGPGQDLVTRFGQYLVPKNADGVANGSCAYFMLQKLGSGVKLTGALSKTRGTSMINNDKGNVVKLVTYTDTKNPLAKGTYGVGSTDCASTFCALAEHKIATGGEIDWNYTLVTSLSNDEEWAYYANRWMRVKETIRESPAANIQAVMPTNQTMKLEFKLPGDSEGWKPSGYEQIINSFSTNKYTFMPRVSPAYQVRLRTGGSTLDDVRTDLSIAKVEVSSWQAENYPDLAYYNGQSFNWVYMQGVVTNLMRTGTQLGLMLQPCRGVSTKAMGLRTPYLANGLSMFSFDYVGADANTRLLLQVCTNLTAVGGVSESLTTYPPNNYNWVTMTNWNFSSTSIVKPAGSLTYYMSLRAPIHGLIRLVMDDSVIATCEANEGKPTRKIDYGQIVITGAYCYDEPALDMRSWYAWNFHTVGWNTEDKRFAYLFDSPDGLSGSLNFSALANDNKETDAATQKIGLADKSDLEAYKANNSFVQCPPLTNGIGSVSFRARTFETNATRKSSWVTLYGAYEPDDDQVVSPDSWKRITDFEVTNTTFHTFEWKTSDDSSQYRAIRLEVANSRNGRNAGKKDEWDAPKATPLQRVLIDEISVGEPIQPRIVFRNVRPFRSGIVDIPPKVVENVADLSEQPLFGESWGIQCTIESQQMSDQLDDESLVVYAAFKRGIVPWGYESWSNDVVAVKLDRIPGTMTFRSSYNTAQSIISPVDTPTATFPDNLWQYYVWAEFKDKEGNKHRHGLDAIDWTVPSWYVGIKDLNETYRSQGFAGYTILDTISPKRAWINEVNICDTALFDNSDGKNQFVEIAVPRGADISSWSLRVLGSGLYRGTLATYGFKDANFQPNPKLGTQMGVDWTNNYTVVALRSPQAKNAGTVQGADGAWDTFDSYTTSKLNLSGAGSFQYYETYGLELVRPSGVIEHQIVVQGTNVYYGTDWEFMGSGTNLLGKIKALDGRTSQWFFAGADQTKGTLGVFRSHGEDETCWTNILIATAGELNKFEDGTRQSIDANWFLPPNGTNVWIYSTVLGTHIHQAIGNKTNPSEVFIIRKGDSTNIVYTADRWWALGEVTTNGVVVAEARGRADRSEGHTWTLDLKNVNETITVYADETAGTDVQGEQMGLEPTDPYFPAIMQWLAEKDDSHGLFPAEFWPLSGDPEKRTLLSLKDMYWLDIDPTESGWVLRAGMGQMDDPGLPDAQPVYTLGEGQSFTNARVTVTMMITNTETHVVRAPDHLLGLEPGSTSYGYDIYSPAWTGVTFKVAAALQRPDSPDVSQAFYPLRWFVFTPDSFDPTTFTATIDLWDPRSKNSPGWFYGWGDYPGLPIYYKWKLDGDPAWYDTAEPLKADSTYSH